MRGRVALLAVVLLVAGCDSGDGDDDSGASAMDTAAQAPPTTAVPAGVTAGNDRPVTTAADDGRTDRVPDTPAPPTTIEPPPPEFEAYVDHVPVDVAARATWRADCPVALEDLRYVRLSHWGFDGEIHTGEMIVHADAAADLVVVFERLLAARFPIEEMRVETPDDVADPPPDYNNTTAFTCRPVTGGTGWSQHAYGLAVDVNPLLNPYLRGDVLLPPEAGPYLDRAALRPGMIVEGDAVVQAFDEIGWEWGGHWRSLKDWQHFSANGR